MEGCEAGCPAGDPDHKLVAALRAHMQVRHPTCGTGQDHAPEVIRTGAGDVLAVHCPRCGAVVVPVRLKSCQKCGDLLDPEVPHRKACSACGRVLRCLGRGEHECCGHEAVEVACQRCGAKVLRQKRATWRGATCQGCRKVAVAEALRRSRAAKRAEAAQAPSGP